MAGNGDMVWGDGRTAGIRLGAGLAPGYVYPGAVLFFLRSLFDWVV